MEIGQRTLGALIERGYIHDYCDDYGEPGYRKMNDDGAIIIGDIWCREPNCDYSETYENGRKKVHSVEIHYPRLFAALEEQGFEFHWYDEWIIEHNSSKAYRTQPDSYHWQSSILWTDGDFLTPDDDIDEWIEEVVNNPRKCLPSHVWSDADLMEKGFEEYNCGYLNGWFEGMNDDPVKITELIRKFEGDVDILFKLSEVSQFYLGFCVFVRKNKEEE